VEETTSTKVKLRGENAAPMVKAASAGCTKHGQSSDPDCPCDRGVCYAYGDPHFYTFDGQATILNKNMNFWFVHSPTVQIQGMSTTNRGYMDGLAVGGDWMKGHKLIIHEKKGAHHDLRVLLDGEEILKKDGDEKRLEGICELHRHPKGSLMPSEDEFTELDGKHWWWRDFGRKRFEDKQRGSGYHFKLPKNVEIFIISRDNLGILIKMSPQIHQGGYCGNFNGDPDDDHSGLKHKWGDEATGFMLDPLEAAEDLFKNASVGSSSMVQEEAADDESSSQQPQCLGELMKKATAACAHIPEEPLQSGCIIDICLTNDTTFAQDALNMQALEVKEAKGMLQFAGHGRCLDQDGKNFSTTEAKEIADRKDCIALAHVAAHMAVEGVRGVQLNDNGFKCQVLMDSGTETHAEQLPGLWGNTAAQQGKGIVGRTSAEPGWHCWKIL